MKRKIKKAEPAAPHFDPKNIRRALIIIIAVFAVLVIYQIAVKILRQGEKVPETVYDTKAVTAKITEVNIYHEFSSVASGDPQIKVFPQVTGKFVSSVKEGSAVLKDDPVVYVDRDIPGMEYKKAPILSPAAGIVTKIYYKNKGDSVTPYFPAAEVADINRIKAVISSGSSFMAGIKPGMRSEIIRDGYIIEGSVSSITPYISQDNMASTAFVKADNKQHVIMPGDDVKVRIYTGKKNAIMIPDIAVITGENKSHVFTVKDNKAVRTEVKTGYTAEGMTEIISGIAPGDIVVTDASFKLNDGALVNIK